ncbi:MAG: hypothetical protein R3298_08930 [Gammaproteobacteria bacterium]|nr:hypothetical protein [Gammaproteobacteria bacterium]
MPIPFRTLIPACLALLLAACALGGPEVVYVADRDYPPAVVVERLHAFPDRPYVVLAELNWTTREQTRREVENRLAEEARKLGADAIVFGRSTSQITTLHDPSGSTETNRQFATAIRYR